MPIALARGVAIAAVAQRNVDPRQLRGLLREARIALFISNLGRSDCGNQRCREEKPAIGWGRYPSAQTTATYIRRAASPGNKLPRER